MNKVIEIGRLTKDPEITTSTSGTTFARFSIAVDRRFKKEGEPDADFFNCTTFGKTAEFIDKWIKKGTKVAITGRLQNNNYTNKEGQKVYTTDVVVEEQEFAESKAASTQAAAAPMPEAPAAPAPDAADPVGDGFMNIPEGIDEALPFS